MELDTEKSNGEIKQESYNELFSNMKSVLVYIDKLMESLPEAKITEFANSKEFVTYKRLFEQLGISYKSENCFSQSISDKKIKDNLENSVVWIRKLFEEKKDDNLEHYNLPAFNYPKFNGINEVYSTKEQDNYKYTILSNGTIRILKYLDFCKTEMVIPERIEGKVVTDIAAECFKGCKELKCIIIPDTVTNIHAEAFDGCSLDKISLPKELKTVGKSAFTDINLTELILPNKIERLEFFSFTGYNLKKILLPKSLINIDRSAISANFDAIFYVYPNSVGLQYCREHNLNYKNANEYNS